MYYINEKGLMVLYPDKKDIDKMIKTVKSDLIKPGEAYMISHNEDGSIKDYSKLSKNKK